MTPVDRREFLRLFGALGGCFVARASLPFVPDGQRAALPRPYAFPQGVASGDPTPEGVVLWSRVESADGRRGPITLRAQVSRSRSFETVLVDRSLTVTEESDHTLRLLVDGLAPGRPAPPAGPSRLPPRTIRHPCGWPWCRASTISSDT